MAVIECHRLSKHYGGLRALDNINLTIESGKPIALIGPNGAGKTTLISAISGFLRPTRGHVTVLNSKPGHRRIKQRFSVLPQDAEFDPNFSVGSQLSLYAKLRSVKHPDNDVSRVLELVQLQDRAKSKPVDLSHGMKKRLLIAQALLGNPDLVLLDEPTAGIDPPNARLIRDLISSESDRTTFVVSSHNLDELEKVCDRVIHLADGKLLSQGAISDETSDLGYLTLVTDNDSSDVINAVDGVLSVTRNQLNEYIVQFDHELNPQFHIALLQKLEQNNIRYKRLINGRTLEEKLYRSNRES